MSPEVFTLIGSISVALIIAIVGPLILFQLQANQRDEERQEDREREDAIAARVAKVAVEVTAAREATATSLSEIKTVADQTHVLVNSNMDEEKNRRLEGAIRELAGLRELIELRRALNQEPSAETTSAVVSAEKTIAELEHEVAERAKRLEVSDSKR